MSPHGSRTVRTLWPHHRPSEPRRSLPQTSPHLESWTLHATSHVCPGTARTSHLPLTKHGRLRGSEWPHLRLQQHRRGHCSSGRCRETLTPEKTRPAPLTTGQEGQRSLPHRVPGSPPAASAPPAPPSRVRASAQHTSPDTLAPGPRSAANVGVSAHGPSQSAGTTFPASHLLKTPKSVGPRGLACIPAPEPRGDLPNLPKRLGSKLSTFNASLQSETPQAPHRLSAFLHTRHHTLPHPQAPLQPGQVEALLRV